MGILPGMDGDDLNVGPRKRHFHGHPATRDHLHGEGDGITPDQSADLPVDHVERTHRLHLQTEPDPNDGQFAPGATRDPTEHFLSTYQAQAMGRTGFPEDDGVGTVRKWKGGKKRVDSAQRPGYGGGIPGGAGMGGLAGMAGKDSITRDPDGLRDLQVGTHKATGHVPGYAGHIQREAPLGMAPRGAPQVRDNVDKAQYLFKENYAQAASNFFGQAKLAVPGKSDRL
ncbi:unnamed protein product [Pedinophyceae sp. YPF-701]|nr:unnamed protein product [Pedinophyceae sp. YPF-701]